MKGVPPEYLKRFREPLADGFFFQTAFYDMTGNMNAAILLSQIYYWHRPGSKGVAKMQHEHEGKTWLRKSHHEWWDEIRLTAGQVRHAIRLLKALQLIDADNSTRYNDHPTVLIRIVASKFFPAFDAALAFHHQVSESTGEPEAGVEIDRGGVEIDRGGVEIDRGGVEIDRGGVENAVSSIVTETTQRLLRDYSETTQRAGVKNNLWRDSETDEIQEHCRALSGSVKFIWDNNVQGDALQGLRAAHPEHMDLEHVKELMSTIDHGNRNGAFWRVKGGKGLPVLPSAITQKLLPHIEQYAAGIADEPTDTKESRGFSDAWAYLLLIEQVKPTDEAQRVWQAAAVPLGREFKTTAWAKGHH